MYELILIWANGDKDVYSYTTREAAENGGENVKMAVGDQLQWYGVRRSN